MYNILPEKRKCKTLLRIEARSLYFTASLVDPVAYGGNEVRQNDTVTVMIHFAAGGHNDTLYIRDKLIMLDCPNSVAPGANIMKPIDAQKQHFFSSTDCRGRAIPQQKRMALW